MYGNLTLPSNNYWYGQCGVVAETESPKNPIMAMLLPESGESHLSIIHVSDDQGRDWSDLIESEEAEKSTAVVEAHVGEKRKLDHNEKEKMRRLKLNDSYSSLCSLLPDSHRSKRKWSSPTIVARVIEYIPELQKEVAKLIQRRDDMQLAIEKKHIATIKTHSDFQALTVSVSEVNKGEAIAQICLRRNQRADILSTLLVNIEREGIWVVGASTLSVCDDRVCFHLHLHMNQSFQRIDYTGFLRDKIVSWLCENSLASKFLISSDTASAA